MKITKANQQGIKLARKILKQGGIIIYPTDTLYGLGADIFNSQAIKKLFAIKGRNFKKPISVMLSDFNQINKLAFINEEQARYIKGLLPGPFTILLKKKKCVSKILTAGSQKVGIRIPDSKFCQKLTKNLPITTTSANISGQKPTLNVKRLTKIFADKACLAESRLVGRRWVDLILIGKKLSGQPSVIIDLTEMPPKIIQR